MRAISSTTAARSPGGSLSHTCSFANGCMFSPPSGEQRLEGCNQLLDRVQGQNGRLRTRFCAKVGASNRNIAVLAGEHLDLAMPHMAGQACDADKLEFSTEKRVGGGRDRDLALAFLGDERGIRLVGVSRNPACRRPAGSPAGPETFLPASSEVAAPLARAHATTGTRSTSSPEASASCGAAVAPGSGSGLGTRGSSTPPDIEDSSAPPAPPDPPAAGTARGTQAIAIP